MSPRRFLVTLFALLPWAAPGTAPAQTWEAIGPFGGEVQLLAQAPGAPDTLYAVTLLGGVFVSADHGLHWRLAGDRLPIGSVVDLVVDAHDPAVLYAGTQDKFSGVLRSADGGATWTKGQDLAGILIAPSGLAVDPRDPRVVWAGTFSGLYRSGDAGVSWEPAGSPFAGAATLAVLADAAHAGTVLAAPLSGVYRSTDGGATWQAGRGLPGSSVDSLAAEPTPHGPIYAGAFDGRVYRSDDGGESWTGGAIPPGPGTVFAPRLTVARNGWVYALSGGVLSRSADRGATFVPLSLPGPPADRFARTVIADAAAANRLLAAIATGVATSDDFGGRWRPASRGLSTSWIEALAIGEGEPPALWASLLSGGVMTRLPGSRWVSADGDLPAGARDAGSALAVDPRHRSRVWRAIPTGVARSDDGGQHWSELAIPDACASFRGVAVDPRRPQTLYVAGAAVSSGCVGAHSWKSFDGGRHWGPLPVESVSITIDPRQPAVLYSLLHAVLRSTDGGLSWTDVSPPGSGPSLVHALAIDPVRPRDIYVANDQGIFRSADRGSTWQPAGAGLPAGSAAGVAVDPGPSQTVYAAISGAGVFASHDRGATWSALGGGLPEAHLGQLVLDAADPLHLYVSTEGFGIFRLALGR